MDFRGLLQCDGYSAYGAFTKSRTGIELGACLAHIRRKFYEAKVQASQPAGFVLKHIQNLYLIEARLRRQRAAARQAESRSIFHRIQKALFALSGRYLPQGAMGKAIAYALAQWSRMEVWLNDGRMEIDNNLVENAIRPTALGKKNWLFFGDAQAGQRSAILYTIIEKLPSRRDRPLRLPA